MSKPFKLTARRIGPDRWQVYDNGSPMYVTSEPPYFMKPDNESAAAKPRSSRKADDAEAAYKRRSADPAFESIRERMRAIAEKDKELEQRLSTDHADFVRAYDSLKLDELTKRHQERLESIRGRQHQRGNGRDRGDADIDVLHAHEEFLKEQEKIMAGNYQTAEED